MDSNIRIKVENLYKIFGSNPKRVYPLLKQNNSKEEILKKTGCVVAVDDVSFEIKKKETFVIMGLSGSGKSTLIRCLNRLIEPTGGKIFIDGKNIMEMDKDKLREVRRYTLSMVFQHFGLLPHRTVVDNVEFGLEISGMEKAERHKKAVAALELVGLKGYEKSMPDELSGGMQQRVGLARALANEPEVLLMDEAFSALDPLIRAQMQDELLELQAKMHKTIVFITHDLDEALKLGDRILILGPGGVIRQIGTPEEILSDPADDYVSQFVQNVDKSKILTVSSIMRHAQVVNMDKDGPGTATRLMEKASMDRIFVVDSERKLKGLVRIDDTVRLQKKKEKSLESILFDQVYTAHPSTPISELLSVAFETEYPIAVIDDEGVFHGVADRGMIIAEVTDDNEEGGPVILSEFIEQNTENGGNEA
jgi:glycine betaine/proline transport system ATP-binding protein